MRYAMTIILTTAVVIFLTLRVQKNNKDMKHFDIRMQKIDVDYIKGCNDSGVFVCQNLKDKKAHEDCLNQLSVLCETWAIKYKDEVTQSHYEGHD